MQRVETLHQEGSRDRIYKERGLEKVMTHMTSGHEGKDAAGRHRTTMKDAVRR